MFTGRVLDAYEGNEYHVVYHELVDYCAGISSMYLDVLKDRLYCETAGSPRRRSAQTVLLRIASDLTRLVAPILPYTADEACRCARRLGSVHGRSSPPAARRGAGAADWPETRFPRATRCRQLETARG
jgi:isoleucyl-tRNA synthetase